MVERCGGRAACGNSAPAVTTVTACNFRAIRRAFLEEMALEGVAVLANNGRGEIRVAVPPGWVTRAFFALADNHGVVLRGLEADDESLEEMFHRVITD